MAKRQQEQDNSILENKAALPRQCVFDHVTTGFGSGSDAVAGEFDTNGVLYLLGTHAGAREYENPVTSREVTAAMSSAYTDPYGYGSAPWRLVRHVHPGGNDICERNFTEDRASSWISIDLGPGRSLRINHYALRHGWDGGTYRLCSWRLEGSNDGTSWTTLKEH